MKAVRQTSKTIDNGLIQKKIPCKYWNPVDIGQLETSKSTGLGNSLSFPCEVPLLKKQNCKTLTISATRGETIIPIDFLNLGGY